MIYAVKVDRDYNSLLSPNTEQSIFFLQSEKNLFTGNDQTIIKTCRHLHSLYTNERDLLDLVRTFMTKRPYRCPTFWL